MSKIKKVQDLVINSLSYFAADSGLEDVLIHDIGKDKIMLLHNGEPYLLNVINLGKMNKEKECLDIMVNTCAELNKLED